MSLAENLLQMPFADHQWEDLPTAQDEGSTRSARRAALVRTARHYVDQFMAVGALDAIAQSRLDTVTSADDIAFGRSDCDFVFRD